MKRYRTLRKIVLTFSTAAIVAATAVIFHSTQSFYKAFSLGKRYFRRAEYQKSLAYFVAASKMEPSNLKVADYLIMAYQKLGMKKEAEDTLEHIGNTGQKDLKIIERLADAYYSLSDYEKAENLYHGLLEQGDSFNIKRKYAEVLAWQKKYQEAALLLEDLIKERPNDLKIMKFLADIYLWAKEYDKSIMLYKKILSSGQGSKDVIFGLSEALRFSGRNEEAVYFYNQYLNEPK